MNIWAYFDGAFIGPSPLVSIESVFPFDVASKRLINLNNVDSDDPMMAELSVDVIGAAVLASYSQPVQTRSGIGYGTFGPVFRGKLVDDNGVRLTGAFGLDDATRWLGVAAVAVALVATIGAFVPVIGYYSLVAWALPLMFLFAVFRARIDGADDVRLIVNNLSYALRGDEDDSA